MVSDEERREVARKLREYTKTGEYLDYALIEAVTGTVDLSEVPKSGTPIGYVVADLIDPQEITEDTSDGYHTFRQLYYQRMKLFSVLVAEHINRAWKTRRHEDGELCFGGGWFLVAIDTPNGTYGYHYEEKYWYEFDCDELPKAKPWDGYDERDVGRLMSLVGEPRSSQRERTCHNVRARFAEAGYECSECHFTAEELRGWRKWTFCPGCDARITEVDDDDD